MRYPITLIALCLACAGEDDDLTGAERAMQDGAYCCIHDGAIDSRPECRMQNGAVFAEDTDTVDDSGRGDLCGWVLNP